MKKILLIEDNKGITEGLCDTFTEPEYELLTAGNLKEAGALLSEHPGLVLLDVSLPDGDGYVCSECCITAFSGYFFRDWIRRSDSSWNLTGY